MSSMPWQEVVRQKCETRKDLVEAHLKTINGEHDSSVGICDIDNIETLTRLLASGEITARDVVQGYVRMWEKISLAKFSLLTTNCLTEVFFDDALVEADRLDDYFRQHKKLIGPLHGVPITLKDQFDVQGADSTIGYVSRAYKPAKKDAVVVQVLKQMGAVILAKTNLPQSIMWCETENPLWGLTTNPKNRDFTPGGSTGGEGVLLSTKASMVGWGTDIGGSIRIPSHINGLWGLKPTSPRLPYRRVAVSTEGQEHVPSSVGPMTRSLSSLCTVMKCVLESKPWTLDPKVVPIPWRQDVCDEVQSRPLTIGVLVDDGVVKVHPPIERLLGELVDKIRGAGHEIVKWDPTGHRECIEIMDQFYTADGGEDVRREVEAGGEPFIPHVQALVNRGKAISVYAYWQLNKQKLAAQNAYNDKWSSVRGPSGRSVDVVLMPTMPHTAVPHRTCRWVGYTKVWNFLDYPALSFPVGSVDAAIDVSREHQPRNPYDEWNWKLYNPKTMHGHPVGLQIVGRRFEEEKVLGVASVIERLLLDRVTSPIHDSSFPKGGGN
ncbi:uncharacterized protein Z520_05196 [Fonsecaea multimorphosa CBS 102226]|uniref:Amidase domain-containing protein n=1 Tax=Fonsecaea multimorphosa CBS 102226 TaxID=1442371 RepID=A0A0D2HA25_9EURO|nr:uncharacterized protein Z520_05196 [Fonsecaea multimorphosa CBS 102226]KIX98735.1 hypothetical protein Z520_05196 [Fonsecaea multimorphosa CBS 102226]OAL25019.1 hypothetical protein AYO22_04896 [Fonsecaea multimorphosa]